MKHALAVSENATAKGMVSDMPIVRGLGPREQPYGAGVVLKATLLRLATLSVRSISATVGLDRCVLRSAAIYSVTSQLITSTILVAWLEITW